MKIPKNNLGDLIYIEDKEFFDQQRIAGGILRRLFLHLEGELKNNANALYIDRIAEEFILDNKCTPTFKNYKRNNKSFPNATCISTNNIAVHGIPNNIEFKSGDIVSIDIGLTYNNSIVDSAHTFIIDSPNNQRELNLVKSTKLALEESIKAIAIESKFGIIGETISRTANNSNYSVITDYGGHGICRLKPHASPFICNRDSKTNGLRIQNGMTFAIEPIFSIANSNQTREGSDGWSVYCNDKSAHFEHTISIIDNKVEVIT